MRSTTLLVAVLAAACSSTDAPTAQPKEPRPAVERPAAAAADIQDAAPADPRTAWLREHAVRIKTVEAGNGFDDLAPLRAMIGDARVVGLGEGTHGTREHFQAKHRLFEFLVEELGFTIFSIEANIPESYALDDYVQGGEGDVAALIGGMYFWTWRTEEVRDLVEWMRAYNARQASQGSERRVRFTGFDMQYARVALKEVDRFLGELDPSFLADGGADALDRLARYQPERRAAAFGCATGRFPTEQARGKTVRLRGWAKTEGLTGGWAGLWWRVDGPTPRFDNMADRGVRGTSDWQELELEIDVPQDAVAIYFGLVMPGEGKAWFDGLSIELNGVPWSSEEFDLDFESAVPRGLRSADPIGASAAAGYAAVLDAAVAKSGAQSFQIASVPAAKTDLPSAEEVEREALAVLEHMQGSRERYLESSDPRAVDWAIQNARVVHQWTGLATRGQDHRDLCMADNVAWILEQDPTARIALWAHNWHVRDEDPWMGHHLRKRLRDGYVNVAFCSSHGEYTAIPVGGGNLAVHELDAPPPESFEAVFESVGAPILLVDLRAASGDDPGSAWLTESRPFGGVIGAVEMPDHYPSAKLQGHFDLLIWLEQTSASRPLRTDRR